MRLERLEITGFGHLGAVRFELAPRMTVLLGANEAGKSTVHRAIRAALYGIDAGGQGRAVAGSEWNRWLPWEGGAYGVTLSYVLADGRCYRIARRLEQRDQVAQVHEVGGRDVTDAMRVGRAVVPGQVHLGIDEAVFCATACVGEESLRGDAPDSASERPVRLQDAIERLADSASRVTAAEALGRLRQAMDRVGTENRSRSALGAATARLRQLGAGLAEARQRAEIIGREQERLAGLEESAAAAERKRVDAECAWLAGRLAATQAQRRELATALEESQRLRERIGGWQRFAGFPMDREERVTALGGELRQALEAEAAAASRWEETRDRLFEIERRRDELASAITALGRVPRIGPADLEEWHRLGEELADEVSVERRVQAVRAAEARADALHREIAATGLGSVPLGAADEVAELIALAATGVERRRVRPLAATLAALGGVLGAMSWITGLHAVAAVVAAAALLGAGGLLLAERWGGGPVAAARRHLGHRCPGLDLSEAGLARAAHRLPDLRNLHRDLQRQDLLAEAGRAELEEATERLAGLAGRCGRLAARLRLEVQLPGASGAQLRGADGLLLQARAALAAVGDASTAGRRRAELEDEDRRLAAEEAMGRRIEADAERCATAMSDIAAELARHLADGGLPPEPDPARAVAVFRQACSTRRQLEAAAARLLELQRRIKTIGTDDDTALVHQAASLEAELRRRDVDPADVAGSPPLDAVALGMLESTAEHARRSALAASSEASGLRERLGGMLDHLPAIADLEDEHAACALVRDRALHQLEALRRASALIEESARRVHRNVAPRLAESVSRRLALLTDGRYGEINVDAERFAVSLRPPGRPDLVPLELLSHGTRDQVALLLRLALTEVLGEAGEPVPLLLDNPLLSADPVRRRAAVDFLLRLSETTQVVITTAEPAIADQVFRDGGEDCRVIPLEREAGHADMPAAAVGATARAARRR
ncbi:MAG TPA: AAA family ATPase [Candidatus Dormibacteraeota bacterium]|nr:AAA family ATPase [Candidatus Dormibacteraeota bacterium]